MRARIVGLVLSLCLAALAACETSKTLVGGASDHGGGTRARLGLPF